MQYKILDSTVLINMRVEFLTDDKFFYVTRITGTRIYFLFKSKKHDTAHRFYERAKSYN